MRVFGDLSGFVAEHARTRVFVHAGVVKIAGGAVLIPGRSMSGKSTLVAALVRAGATYYSDDYALVDGRGQVHPYPRALSLRSSDDPWSGRPVPVESLGGRAGSRPLPVRAVVVTRYRPGGPWRPRRQPPGRGFMALLDNAVAARTHPDRVLPALRAAMQGEGIEVLNGPRGEAEECAAAILRRFG